MQPIFLFIHLNTMNLGCILYYTSLNFHIFALVHKENNLQFLVQNYAVYNRYFILIPVYTSFQINIIFNLHTLSVFRSIILYNLSSFILLESAILFFAFISAPNQCHFNKPHPTTAIISSSHASSFCFILVNFRAAFPSLISQR